MSWRSVHIPYFAPGHVQRTVHFDGRRPLPRCPAALRDILHVNGLVPDENTAGDGNCGVDAFVRSFLACSPTKRGHRNHYCSALRKAENKLAVARDAAAEWLVEHANDSMWDAMTIRSLCQTVSGIDFDTYVRKMRRAGEWVDSAFLHALGCRYGVGVAIFQVGTDPCLVGAQVLPENATEDHSFIVPIGLVNDFHFWGTTPGAALPRPTPIDKGEHPALRASLGMRPGSKATREAEDDYDETMEDEPGASTYGTHAENIIGAELSLCQALGRWSPFGHPSEELLIAMAAVRACGKNGSGEVLSVASNCCSRAAALLALSYEITHADALPERLKCQRLAQMRLQNPFSWQRQRKGTNITSQLLVHSSHIMTPAALTKHLEHQQCDHADKPECCGLQAFTAADVYNWRVLWRSLPWVSRKENLLALYQNSLSGAGCATERWRVQYQCLGRNVCRKLFMALTGIGASSLQNARSGTLEGKVSYATNRERGLHGAGMTNNAKPAAYLGARQWLEHYADRFAEWSPMDGKAYLPAGRKHMYYYGYFNDITERHGLKPEDVMRQPAKRRKQGVETPTSASSGMASDAAGPATQASVSTLAVVAWSEPNGTAGEGAVGRAQARAGALADVPLADLSTFLKAWRTECPWLVVHHTVSMFTRCGVCEYLKMLIDQTPRGAYDLREALKARLGDHFAFQGAQRLAHGRVEEECSQSDGEKWFMLIDKMNQNTTVCPSIWSQLSTPFFKDLDRRLICGLNGSMWFGPQHTTHHVRTIFLDCSHGSEMQCSCILQNLSEVACREGHLPETFFIGADNTRKETKNQICMWFLIWLLCALKGTSLWCVEVLFLLVGHTHNKLDRMFSRISVALRGRDYFTVVGMLRRICDSLMYCKLETGHLGQVWAWKGLNETPMPGHARQMHNLDPVHAIRLTRQADGVHMQWKHWCTDPEYSNAVRIIDGHEMQTLAEWRPIRRPMEFPQDGRNILSWIERLEAWCAAQPEDISEYHGLQNEFEWLRAAVNHTLPGVYAPGMEVDHIVRQLRSCGSHATRHVHETSGSLPHDIVSALYPNADGPSIPAANLVRIDGVTHKANGQRLQSDFITPGSLVIIAAPQGTQAREKNMTILLGMVVQTSTRRGTLTVAWYVPALSLVETFRNRTSRQILDVYGPWRPTDELTAATLQTCVLPSPLISLTSVLECNFELTENNELPYSVFDALLARHNIDMTGLNMSSTRRGNMYRSYVLMKGTTANQERAGAS